MVPAGLSILKDLPKTGWVLPPETAAPQGMRQPQDLQELLFPSLSFRNSPGLPLPWTGRYDKITASSKVATCPTNIFSPALLRIMLSKQLQATVCCCLPTLWTALAGLSVAQQSTHPVHIPLARSKKDNDPDKAISSRGCSQNHEGRGLGRGLQCAVAHMQTGFEAS